MKILKSKGVRAATFPNGKRAVTKHAMKWQSQTASQTLPEKKRRKSS